MAQTSHPPKSSKEKSGIGAETATANGWNNEKHVQAHSQIQRLPNSRKNNL